MNGYLYLGGFRAQCKRNSKNRVSLAMRVAPTYPKNVGCQFDYLKHCFVTDKAKVMKFDRQKHQRRSVRLPYHEYVDGVYFVTICAYQRECVFGEVVGEYVQLNDWGKAVDECWNVLPIHFQTVEPDAFVVMPDHLHGIVILRGNAGAQNAAPLQNVAGGSLGAVVRSLKSAVTRKINLLRETPGAPVWQRNYYEHVIRDEKSLNALRAYIQHNPARWAEDKENPWRKCRRA